MIFYDVTKAGSAGHRSGLMRVNWRLREELGGAVQPVDWASWNRSAGRGDRFFTAELFSEAERPGLREFLRTRPCRCEAVFYDAIPMKFPAITWPQSVARHPGYMKLLAEFDKVWAISKASREELIGYWRWLGLEKIPPVEVLTLGADFAGKPRASGGLAPSEPAGPARPGAVSALLSVGILEPRKNQMFLLEVCEHLWTEGMAFDLHLVGRVNPLFGRPLLGKVRELRRRGRKLHHHAKAGDEELAALYATARASIFPTRAEGCGLPLLESLWMGVPCVCSDLPVLAENFGGGGCLPVAPDDRPAWKAALRAIVADDSLHDKLTAEARRRPLPTWAEAAKTIARAS